MVYPDGLQSPPCLFSCHLLSECSQALSFKTHKDMHMHTTCTTYTHTRTSIYTTRKHAHTQPHIPHTPHTHTRACTHTTHTYTHKSMRTHTTYTTHTTDTHKGMQAHKWQRWFFLPPGRPLSHLEFFLISKYQIFQSSGNQTSFVSYLEFLCPFPHLNSFSLPMPFSLLTPILLVGLGPSGCQILLHPLLSICVSNKDIKHIQINS